MHQDHGRIFEVKPANKHTHKNTLAQRVRVEWNADCAIRVAVNYGIDRVATHAKTHTQKPREKHAENGCDTVRGTQKTHINAESKQKWTQSATIPTCVLWRHVHECAHRSPFTTQHTVRT